MPLVFQNPYRICIHTLARPAQQWLTYRKRCLRRITYVAIVPSGNVGAIIRKVKFRCSACLQWNLDPKVNCLGFVFLCLVNYIRWLVYITVS